MIIGLDISRYQGKLTAAIVSKMVQAGVQFVGIKYSQGTGWKDPEAENSTQLLQSAGVKTFAYHFVTISNAAAQYDWFVKCMGSFQFDLPPMLDCEYYTAASSSSLLTARGLGLVEPEVQIIEEFRYNDVPFSKRLGRIFGAYVIPNEYIVESIGVSLTAWMKTQVKVRGLFDYPSIYTNVSSGNAIFKTPAMSRYNLHVANWGVTKPYLPTIWKAANRYIMWQDNVVAGTPYGLTANVDHNVWGNQFAFPTTAPVEPPDPVDPPIPPDPTTLEYIDLDGIGKYGKHFTGRMTEVK